MKTLPGKNRQTPPAPFTGEQASCLFLPGREARATDTLKLWRKSFQGRNGEARPPPLVGAKFLFTDHCLLLTEKMGSVREGRGDCVPRPSPQQSLANMTLGWGPLPERGRLIGLPPRPVVKRRHPETPGVLLMDKLLDKLLMQVVAPPTDLQAA
jgi:hypothetical protein